MTGALTHEQKLQRAAELLARKPARLIEQVLIKAMIGVVDGSVEAVQEAEARVTTLEAEVERLREDAERLEWIEQKLFVQKWNGVVGSDCSTHWGIAPDYRHTVHNMKNGDIKPDFRAAIDAARAALESKT